MNGVLQVIPVERGQQVGPGTNLARVADPSTLKATSGSRRRRRRIWRSASRRTSTRATATSRATSRASTRLDERHGRRGRDARRRAAAGRASGPQRGRRHRARAARERAPGRAAGVRPGEQTVGLFKLIPTDGKIMAGQEAGHEATQTPVKLGKASVQFIEVLEGLKEGDRVVLSDMSQYDGFEPHQVELAEGVEMSSRPDAHQSRRRHEDLLHRRSRDARPGGHPPRDPARRVHLDCRAVGLRQVDAALDSRPARHADRRQLRAERPVGGGPAALRARARAQPRDRVHLPELQPDRRPDRLRERRAAAHLSRHEVGRAQGARDGRAREGRHVAPREAPAEPALRRSAAARRRGPRRLRLAVDPARRRAHRQPRLEERRGGHGPAAASCTRKARPSAWSRTIRATPSTPSDRFTCSTAASSRKTPPEAVRRTSRRAASTSATSRTVARFSPWRP